MLVSSTLDGKWRRLLFCAGLLLTLIGSTGCSGSDPASDDDDDGDVPSLQSLAADRGLVVGTAAEASHLTLGPFVEVMVREFASVTPGNAMKMGPLRPAPDSYDFSEADAFVDFAEGQGLAIRGHVLVWHQQQPSWLTSGNWSREAMMSILYEHITTVVGRYRGRLYAWDVVNEAFADDGSLRQTMWLETIGPEYIDLAFQWAHEADPDARLFYNDYNTEGSGAKSDAVYQLVRRLRDDGIPIDGVGFQMHVTTDFSPTAAAVSANLARLAGLGLEVHITEMDVRMPMPADGTKLARQASIYAEMLEACLGAPNCTTFILWGLTDRYSWIPSTFPGFGSALIFDEDYEPKLAYHAMMSVLED
jgi:endo-1,4-beta-xylanase